jgi:hypothetical protein
MPPVGFEPIISAGERPQTDSLDRAATGTGSFLFNHVFSSIFFRYLQIGPYSANVVECDIISRLLPVATEEKDKNLRVRI